MPSSVFMEFGRECIWLAIRRRLFGILEDKEEEEEEKKYDNDDDDELGRLLDPAPSKCRAVVKPLSERDRFVPTRDEVEKV